MIEAIISNNNEFILLSSKISNVVVHNSLMAYMVGDRKTAEYRELDNSSNNNIYFSLPFYAVFF
jgi:hypothetical protein